MENEVNLRQILETDRLRLEPLNLKHKNALYLHFSDDEVMKYLDIPSLTNVEEAEKIIQAFGPDKKNRVRWALIRKSDNQFIGTCGFNSWVKEQGNRSVIGYDLAKLYWQKGYMSEALHAIFNFGFKTMKLNRIQALVSVNNDNSRKLLTKLGFTEEGRLRQYGYMKGQYYDLFMYSLLKNEWEDN